MNPTRTRLLVALLAVSTVLLLATGVALLGPITDGSPGAETDDRPADPSTEDTVGYVEGYWYDDDLSIDDRDDAAVKNDELEAVVYRSMARVERIRGLTFDDEVSVEVVSRQEFREDDDPFADTAGDGDGDRRERIELNVHAEALFAVDRETDATAERATLYGDAVEGYYEPGTDRIVIVSDNPETPELNEVILGHELVHALQDQRFDLTRFDHETQDRANANNGLIEGDAVWVESAYEDRCDTEWDCVLPGSSEPTEPQEYNWVLYMTLYQPYDDGPDYVEYLLERDDWEGVNAAYDEPPASSSEVIRPGEEREPVPIEIEDRSSEAWDRFETRDEDANETFGEAAMVSMLGANVHDSSRPSVLDRSAILESDLRGYDYDQPYTDGWAGDELVVYATDEATATDDPAAAAEHAGYVWRTEWVSDADSLQFVDGYLQLLELYGADPVEGYRNTYVIDDAFPGAYYVDRDGETVTIVRAPSVDELPEIDAAAAPEGEDTLEDVDAVDEASLGEADAADAAGEDDDDGIPGFGIAATAVAVSIVVLVRRVRTGTGSDP